MAMQKCMYIVVLIVTHANARMPIDEINIWLSEPAHLVICQFYLIILDILSHLAQDWKGLENANVSVIMIGVSTKLQKTSVFIQSVLLSSDG